MSNDLPSGLKEIETKINSIEGLLRKRDFSQASNEYNNLKLCSINPALNFNMAILAYEMCDIQVSKEYILQVSGLKNDRKYLLTKSNILYNSGDINGAITSLLEAQIACADGMLCIDRIIELAFYVKYYSLIERMFSRIKRKNKQNQYRFLMQQVEAAMHYDCNLFKKRINFNPDKKYFLSTSGTGELFFACICVDHLLSQMHSEDINLILEEKHENVVKLFPSLERKIVLLPSEHISKLAIHRSEKLFESKIINFNPKFSLSHPSGRLRDRCIHPGILLNDSTTNLERQKIGMGISLSEKMTYKHFDYFSTKPVTARVTEITSKPSVLLSPFARSLQSPHKSFWDNLFTQIEDIGLNPVVSVGPKDNIERYFSKKDIQTINFRHNETVEVIHRFLSFIGARSGLCDILAYMDIDMHIIYTHSFPRVGDRFPQYNSWSLTRDNLRENQTLKEYIYQQNNNDLANDICRKIVNSLRDIAP